MVWAMKVGDGRTDGQSLYKSFHFLRYKRSVEAKRETTANYQTRTECKSDRNNTYQ